MQFSAAFCESSGGPVVVQQNDCIGPQATTGLI